MYKLILLAAITIAISCQKPTEYKNIIYPISINWTLDSISVRQPQMSYVKFEITNNGNIDIAKDTWEIHYNQMGGKADKSYLSEGITFDSPSGDYMIISANEDIKVNQTVTLQYGIPGIVDKMSRVPQGVFIVIDGHPSASIPLDIKGVNTTVLKEANPATNLSRYQEYKNLSLLSNSELLPFIPSPQQFTMGNGQLELQKTITFSLPQEQEHLLTLFKDHQSWLNLKFEQNKDKTADVEISRTTESKIGKEGYRLEINKNGVRITSSDDTGAFYGLQSLIQLMYFNISTNGSLSLPYISVTDYPRFEYRGLHLDVARNFHSIDAVKKILNMMSFFKLNKFHFHLTDDEGWRLEIPELPELTEIGGKRGYTIDERDHLRPSYGSGPDPEKSYGSGYYTIEEFKSIIKYASERHIEVIPEIDLPGHARAAIKAMKVRYERLMNEGNSAEANKFLLHDDGDKSVYNSAQDFTDNVICVCQDGAFNFVEHVLESVITMFKEADVPLNYLHIGGDEIPAGAWEQSPICHTFIEVEKKLQQTADLPPFFITKIRKVLDKHNISIAGWEEIMLVHGEEGHNTTDINMDMVDGKTLPYVWNAVWGWGREDMIYKLANAGSPVVMCNSASFYFDMAYDKSPNEIGLSWSGFSNTKTVFGLDPIDMFKNARLDVSGAKLDPATVAAMTRITEKGIQYFKGIQAQLWSETLKEEKWIDYMMYPKMFGFAQRAWSPKGEWMNYNTHKDVDREFEKSWNQFANTIGQKGFPMLDKIYGGIEYRHPRIGKNETGETRSQYPGSTINSSIN